MPTEAPCRIISDEEFEQIYKENYSYFLRYAATIFHAFAPHNMPIGDRAEEAVQEMCAFAWANRDKMAEAEFPVRWMVRVLFFKMRELLRDEQTWAKRMQQISEQFCEEDVNDFRLKVELEDLIPPEDYLLLKRLYLDGYTYAEVGDAMSLKKSALAMRVKRIKEQILAKIDEDEKFFSKRCEQSPPGRHYRVEEVHEDGT